MAKVAIPLVKYVIEAHFEVDGLVEKPDVVGAIFGQTEGLLGPDLDLRELQKGGKIGRIDVHLEHKSGKTLGKIIIPTTLDMVETALVAAVLETVEKIGPAPAKVKVLRVEDVREDKRKYVIERAKSILRDLIEKSIPDSSEITERLREELRANEIIEYGEERLPAGPGIFASDEIIVVEGRADVVNLLRYGFKNVIGMKGTKVPKTIIELSKKKTTIAFVDGDRGGELILRELLKEADIDYIVKAPPGKEVEELSRKEITKLLRQKIPAAEYLKKHERKVAPKEILERIKDYVKEISPGELLLLNPNYEVLGKIKVEEIKQLDEIKPKIVVGKNIPTNTIDLLIKKGIEFYEI